MEWIKLENMPEQGGTYRVFRAKTDRNLLSVPAEDMVIGSEIGGAENNQTAEPLFCVAKKQSVVLYDGKSFFASRAREGNYLYQGEDSIKKVYFVHTGEISGKIFETSSPVVYPAEESNLGVSQDIRMQCSCYFVYRIKNPKSFLASASKYKDRSVTRQKLETEMNKVFSAYLPEVFRIFAEEGISYTEICEQTDRITELMKEKLASVWKDLRGIDLKKYTIVMANANKKDEKNFLKQCQAAENNGLISDEETEETSSGFVESLDQIMKAFSNTAEEALESFQEELASIFGGLGEADDDEDDGLGFDIGAELDDILNGNFMNVLGEWECKALKQSIEFSLLEAVIKQNGEEIWRGDWVEKEEAEGTHRVICPSGEKIGCYEYFECHPETESGEVECLAAVISDADGEKQFIQFNKK